jgi:hypothetical protein
VWVITRAVGTTCDPESDGKAIYHLLLTVRTNIRSLLADSPRAGSIGGATSRAPATSLREPAAALAHLPIGVNVTFSTMISSPTNRTMALNFALLPSVRVKTAFAMKPKAFSPGPTPVRLLSVLVKVP